MLSTARLFGQTIGAALVALMFGLFGERATTAGAVHRRGLRHRRSPPGELPAADRLSAQANA